MVGDDWVMGPRPIIDFSPILWSVKPGEVHLEYLLKASTSTSTTSSSSTSTSTSSTSSSSAALSSAAHSRFALGEFTAQAFGHAGEGRECG